MSIHNYIKENNEQIIGNWNLNMIPLNEDKARFAGKLFVSDKNLYFDAQFNTSLSGAVDSLVVSINTVNGYAMLVSYQIVKQWKDLGFLIIPKSKIKEVNEECSFLKKTVSIKLADKTEYKFDYGLFPVKKITEAIKN